MDWRQRLRLRLKDDPRRLDELADMPPRTPRPAPTISRRGMIGGLALIAAPFVIRTPGLLMPVRDRTILTARELELQALLGTRDWERYPATIVEVKAWRRAQNWSAERGMTISLTGFGWERMHAMRNAERRFEAMGLL